MSGYRLFAQVNLSHDYFDGTTGRDFTVRADLDTQRFLQRFGMLLRCDGRAIALYVDDSRLAGLWSERRDEEGDRLLRFWLRSADADYPYYTVLADQPVEYRMGADLTGLEPGETIAYPHKGDRGELAMLVLPFNPSGTDDEAAWVEHFGRQYQLRVGARATVWKYLLVGNWTDSALRVVDLRESVSFSAPLNETLPDGRQATVIRSQTPIRLQEKPAHRFQLCSGGQQNERVLIARMPGASPRSLRYESVDGNVVAVSEIFINR